MLDKMNVSLEDQLEMDNEADQRGCWDVQCCSEGVKGSLGTTLYGREGYAEKTLSAPPQMEVNGDLVDVEHSTSQKLFEMTLNSELLLLLEKKNGYHVSFNEVRLFLAGYLAGQLSGDKVVNILKWFYSGADYIYSVDEYKEEFVLYETFYNWLYKRTLDCF